MNTPGQLMPLREVVLGVIAAFVLASTTPGEVSARDAVLAPGKTDRSGEIRSKAVLHGPRDSRDGTSFDIQYDEHAREIHIYGQKDSENHATVDLVSGLIVGEVWVRVVLASGSVVSGDVLVKEFLYHTTWESAAPDDSPWIASDPDAEPAPSPESQALVDEIFFYGSSLPDYFENNTPIPSWAEGGAGDDEFHGGSSVDTFYGGYDDDTLRGREGDDNLYGGFGSDTLYGDQGDDYLEVTATGNAADVNKLCGGDGADTLIGAPFVNNELDGEGAGGASDGDVDTLVGHSSLESYTTYEFTPGEDQITENGVDLDPDDSNYPIPDFITCG